MVDGPFNEDSKIQYFFQGGPKFVGGMVLSYKSGTDQFQERILASVPWYQNFCGASIFLHARPNFMEKMKKLNLLPKFDPFLGCSLPKIYEHNQNFYI